MNLIMEGWRRFLNEAAISEATRLAIFDFDGTIGFTGSKVAIINKETGETSKFSDEQYLEFLNTLPEEERKKIEQKPYEGDIYTASYEDYYTVPDETEENRPVLEKMAEFARDNETSLFVLTARAPGPEEDDEGEPYDKKDPMSAIDGIQIYLHTFGIKPDHIEALAGKPKAAFIDGLLRQNPSVTELVVYEDSMSNLESIDSMMAEKYSGFRHTVRNYKKIEQKVVDYSLFYVEKRDAETGEAKVTELPTKAKKKRRYDEEREETHREMSDYLHREHGLQKNTKGIALVMSQSAMRVKDLVKSLRSVRNKKWDRHLDSFISIMQNQIR